MSFNLNENTHRMPLTRSLFGWFYKLSKKREEYRQWLLRRQKPLTLVASIERDLWILLTKGCMHRINKADELKVAHSIRAEASIRGQTLVDQLTLDPSVGTIRLSDIRLAHPLLLDQVKSQQRKFDQRVAALKSWYERTGLRFLSAKEIERLIPSADPIIITNDPLEQSPYVSATGNGRLAALKAALPADCYIEVLCYLPLERLS